jgi:hypothetical protein
MGGMGKMGNSYKISVGKPDGKRPLGRRGRRQEDNIRMDVREACWVFVDWMHVLHVLDQWLALVNMVMNLRVT